jgi:hypothetical protein
MSKSENRKIQKSIQKKMNIDPNAKALDVSTKNFKGFSAKSNGTKPTDRPR